MEGQMQDVLAGRARWAVVCADAADALKEIPTASVDALIGDPPSGTAFMQTHWDRDKGGRDQWIAWLAGIMAEARRCIRPGGYALVWALPRTGHWTATALEDAGFEIRDSIHHLFGSGFPKGKSCLKPAHEVWWLAKAPGSLQPLQIDACRVAAVADDRTDRCGGSAQKWGTNTFARDSYSVNVRGSESPAHDGGRWPPNTLLSHHPDCQPAGVRRVQSNARRNKAARDVATAGYGGGWGIGVRAWTPGADGHGSEQVDAWSCHPQCPIRVLDEQAGPRPSSPGSTRGASRHIYGHGAGFTAATGEPIGYRDASPAVSRFFPTFPCPDPEDAVPFRYEPKASRRERESGLEAMEQGRSTYRPNDPNEDSLRTRLHGSRPHANDHPTCKPTSLMAWLCKLVTKEDGVVLDCFGGSGSTAVAALRCGMRAIIIEQDAHYCDIARARIAHAEEQQSGPLFAGIAAQR